MTAFSAVVDGFERTPAHVAEIVDGTNERRLAAIASGATGLPSAISTVAGSAQEFLGDGVTKPVHLLIQELLEAMAGAGVYVDHGAAVPVGTLYDLASWRSRAGLHEDGFRRATTFSGTEAPTYSYGLIQTGDLAGYWIWEDIIGGLAALKWTRKMPSQTSSSEETRTGASGAQASVVAAVAAADLAWASAGWVSATHGKVRVNRVALVETVPGTEYTCTASAGRTTQDCDLSVVAPVDVTVEFWGRTDGYAGYAFDFEGWGFFAWTKWDEASIDKGDDTVNSQPNITTPTATPADDSGIAAYTSMTTETAIGAIRDYTAQCLLKWVFDWA